MGTHPIFESDFDCLTEMLYRNTRIISRNLFLCRPKVQFGVGVYNYLQKKSILARFQKEMKHELKRSAGGVLRKNRSFYETPFDDLASGTEIALVQKLLFHEAANENSDISVMFCPRSPHLKYQTRKQWNMLSPHDKIFYGKEIFKDCEIFFEKYVARDGQYFMAVIWSKVSKLPETYQDIKTWHVRTMIETGDKYGYQYVFALTFKYDEKAKKWQLQMTPDWPR